GCRRHSWQGGRRRSAPWAERQRRWAKHRTSAGSLFPEGGRIGRGTGKPQGERGTDRDPGRALSPTRPGPYRGRRRRRKRITVAMERMEQAITENVSRRK